VSERIACCELLMSAVYEAVIVGAIIGGPVWVLLGSLVYAIWRKKP
jgi:hypothetical protein